MKHIVAVLAFTCFLNQGYGQKEIYRSSKFAYEVNLTSWLKVLTTDTAVSFGGTMPAVDNIENAILITGFSKDKFTSFADFQRIYITGNVFGKPTLYNEHQIWYGRNQSDSSRLKMA
jgi:hypothetical protein